MVAEAFGFTNAHSWTALSARSGAGKSVALETTRGSGAVIVFRSRLQPHHVKDGVLKPIPVIRDGNSRIIALTISEEQADSLYQLLSRYQKRKKFFNRLFFSLLDYTLRK